MARQDPALTHFNGGEVSPWLRGRVDAAKYGAGCESLSNMICRLQGPAVRRPGTQYVGKAKQDGDVALLSFQASTASRTVLEFGPNYLRFWDGATRAQINDNAGTWSPGGVGGPAELGTSWGALFNADGTLAIQTAQSNDVMWLVHPTTMPQKLSRIAPYKFKLANIGDGTNIPVPFKDVDPLNPITITASATSGVGITLTASAPYFTADMVNEYFYLEQPSADPIAPWETNKAVVIGDRRKSQGRNYIAGTAATTGTSTPVHTYGSKIDGATGVVWTFFDDGFGVVGITSITDSTHAVVTGAIQLPDSVRSVGTTRFARQAWNIVDGYPTSISFFRDRLCFGRGQSVWFSVAGDYENFQRTTGGQATSDLAIAVTIASEKNDRILWARGLGRLLLGTAGNVWSMGEATSQQPFGPDNINAHPCSAGTGATPCAPVKHGEGLLYVQAGGTRLRELLYDVQIDDYRSIDLSQYSEHIGQTGLQLIVPTFLPDPIIWTLGVHPQADPGLARWGIRGSLNGLTYDRAEQVAGWHPHQLAGRGPNFQNVWPTSATSVVSPDGTNDDLWLLTRRFDSGAYLEVIGPAPRAILGDPLPGLNPYIDYTQVGEVRDSNYLDFSAPVQTAFDAAFIPCAWIPIGEQAQALCNGSVVPQAATVAQGLPTFKSAIGIGTRPARVGFGYLSDLKPNVLIGGSATGAPQTKISNVWGVGVRLLNSSSFLYGRDAGSQLDRHEFRDQHDPMDNPVQLRSGDFFVRPASSNEEDPRIFIRQDQPLPLNVLALFPRLNVEDSR